MQEPLDETEAIRKNASKKDSKVSLANDLQRQTKSIIHNDQMLLGRRNTAIRKEYGLAISPSKYKFKNSKVSRQGEKKEIISNNHSPVKRKATNTFEELKRAQQQSKQITIQNNGANFTLPPSRNN